MWIKKQKDEIKKLLNEMSALRIDNNVKEGQIKELKKQLENLKNKEREQTKADMVFEALQVLLTALNKTTKTEDVKPDYDAMMQQKQAWAKLGQNQIDALNGAYWGNLIGSLGGLK